ncbi:thiol-disulfide isomerase/thioredoxin [Cytobacillus horneckiae]|uniref:Thioredoxin n=1 Tax=Cytobacillus horneckiae TaxID=549687 RepID=A0A2N0ZAF6_9BACI|nr:thioredoxin family protein [Cytobacillus horneckiae]MBN6889402.1 thioredoxin family protein [Cytobacillus horneckiae]MCM3179533.1 thioredoxin family protein [Cytobacillus horneckiae]MEC1154957.1 thioredoxin family protein [Cytobacillus horneckiae]MED2936137.1 thioredoxin family protein [Cytobacillus horneckiae]PKG26479.1 thioredoxin [Cytobacillus horneckiae]
MKKLQSMEQFEELKDNGKHIFMFSAQWCGDCRFIEPFMPEVEEKFKEFTFIYVDRDDFLDLCIKLDVFGIPSFVGYRDGQELGRLVSKDRKTQAEIEQFISSLA